jgi:FlaA1/EpsC-like NDP-sugar epimerase
MTDYLRKMGKGLRIVSAVALMLMAIPFILGFIILAVDGVCHWSSYRDNIDIHGLASLMLIGLFCVCACYLALRLWRGTLSPNAVTVIPARFIQVFGVFFMAAVIFNAYRRNIRATSIIEAVLVATAMIFVNRHVARRERRPDDHQACDSQQKT